MRNCAIVVSLCAFLGGLANESGEGYLIPASYFVDAKLSKKARDAITNGCAHRNLKCRQ